MALASAIFVFGSWFSLTVAVNVWLLRKTGELALRVTRTLTRAVWSDVSGGVPPSTALMSICRKVQVIIFYTTTFWI